MKTMVNVVRRDGSKSVVWQVACHGTCGDTKCRAHYVRRVFVRGGKSRFMCDCPGYVVGHHICCHIKAVWRYECAANGFKLVFSKTESAAKSQHRKVYVARGADGLALAWATRRKAK